MARLAKAAGFAGGARLLAGVLLAGVLAATAAGCGRGGEGAEPPRLVTGLVRDLFTALAARDYAAAGPTLARLRDLYPGNVYLAELQQAVATNLVVHQVQGRMDEDDPAGAAAAVAAAIRVQGRQDQLVALQDELAPLLEAHALVEICLAPPQAIELARAASRLRTLAASDPRLAPFRPAADRQLARARELLGWERRRAIDDLCSELDRMLAAGDRDAYILLAELAVADPEHPTVRAWRRVMAVPGATPPPTFAAPGPASARP